MHVIKYMFSKEIEADLIDGSAMGLADILLYDDWKKFDWQFIHDLCERHRHYPQK